jgi:hypothetical protein
MRRRDQGRDMVAASKEGERRNEIGQTAQQLALYHCSDDGLGNLMEAQRSFKCPRLSEVQLKGAKPPSIRALAFAHSAVTTGTGVWSEMNDLVQDNPELGALRDGLVNTLAASRADNTFKTYAPMVKAWEVFAGKHGMGAFPASRAGLLLYLQGRMDRAKMLGNRESNVINPLYAIDFAHRVRGLDLPSTDPMFGLVIEAARKTLGRPTVRKKAATKELVKAIVRALIEDPSNPKLSNLRVVLYCQLAFVLEARWDNVVEVCPNHIFDYDSHIVVFVERSKTDTYREGAFVPILDTGDPSGVCALLRFQLGAIAGLGEGQGFKSIFRRVNWGKVRGEYLRQEVMGYDLMLESVRKALSLLGEDPLDYGLHSFRSGAASHAEAGKDIPLALGPQGGDLVSAPRLPLSAPVMPSRLLEKHGGWCPNSRARLGYVDEAPEAAFLIPASLRL